MVFFLGADVQDDVGHRQELLQFLAVGQVVAVQVRRIHNNFALEGQPVVCRKAAMLQSWIEPGWRNRIMVVDHRIARGRTNEGSLGNGAPGQSVEQSRLADPRAPHQHDDQ